MLANSVSILVTGLIGSDDIEGAIVLGKELMICPTTIRVFAVSHPSAAKIELAKGETSAGFPFVVYLGG